MVYNVEVSERNDKHGEVVFLQAVLMRDVDDIDKKINLSVYRRVHFKVRDPVDRSTHDILSKDAWTSIYDRLYRVLTHQINRGVYVRIVRLSRYENEL